MTPRARFRRLELDALLIDDERSLRHVELYARLKALLVASRYSFRVRPEGDTGADWNRAAFLNLTFWTPDDPADVLVDEHIPADVVAHVAWHWLAARALGEAATTADGLLLGESIASAFDLYLVGRLIGHAPRSSFLRTQVPAMAETAQSAALDELQFSSLLGSVAADPEAAFADLRALLFDVATTLLRAHRTDDAARLLDNFSTHRFHPLLHHYNVSNWILHARANAAPPSRRLHPQIAKIDKALARAAVPLEWLEANWLGDDQLSDGRGRPRAIARRVPSGRSTR